MFEQMGRYHPRQPHWFLPFIGVDPFHQGKGYGAALIQHALIPCDGDHTLAYLESSNPKNTRKRAQKLRCRPARAWVFGGGHG